MYNNRGRILWFINFPHFGRERTADKNGDTEDSKKYAEKMYKDVVEANNVLKDKKKR